MLSDDISLLDGAVLMIDELICPAGKAWNDRHTVNDTISPPLQDPKAWLGIIVPGEWSRRTLQQYQCQHQLFWDPGPMHVRPVFQNRHEQWPSPVGQHLQWRVAETPATQSQCGLLSTPGCPGTHRGR